MADTNTYPGTDTASQQAPTQDERTLGMIAHLITFISSFIGPLVIYLIKKDESPFVAEHAKESLNFQITVAIICGVLIVTLIGILLLWIVGIIALVLVIVAGLKANEGKPYKYPFCIRLIK